MAEAPKKSSRGAGRVAFLARLDSIRKMVEEGYPVVLIYEQHGEGMGISYSQFARYVARYVQPPSPRA
ncbi:MULTISPECIES: TraK family protein [Pseudomonadota]|jgi:hypothetical protein|uniref:TraK family protein n=1 Tax=Pseudomonadota TaxID=1224 RepID=UPI001621C81C|nr:hypothetical protein [Chelatococcus composti]MBU9652819.1 TraK family protein [Burkholderia multivorans]